MGDKFTLREYSLLTGIVIGGSVSMDAQLVYRDLDPDIIVGPDNQYIDINEDTFNDFKIHKELLFSSNTLLECYSTILFEIECLNPENSLIGYAADGMKDVVYAIDYGYPINTLAGLTPDVIQYATFKWQEVSCLYLEPVGPWFYPNVGHWASQREEDVFIGFKFYSVDDECPRFGWMRCNISEDLEQITIKDLAYNEDCGKGLFAGMLISEIQGSTADAVFASVYMGNANLHINLAQTYSNLYCNVYNMSGQLVMKKHITELTTSISLSNYTTGVYQVQLVTSEGNKLVKRFFIE